VKYIVKNMAEVKILVQGYTSADSAIEQFLEKHNYKKINKTSKN